MKRFILIFASVMLTQLSCVREAAAFPGERVLDKTAHFAQKVGQKIDRHVVQPGRRVVARHLPG